MRLGPITIMRTRKHDNYRKVVAAAWVVHETIWSFGENNVFPSGLKMLPEEDAVLSEALSYAPIEDAPR